MIPTKEEIEKAAIEYEISEVKMHTPRSYRDSKAFRAGISWLMPKMKEVAWEAWQRNYKSIGAYSLEDSIFAFNQWWQEQVEDKE